MSLTDIRLAGAVLYLQNTILEMIARGETLEATMARLCREIELLLPEVICSVLSVERNGLLHPLAAPSLPESYSALLDGLMIGPEVGSCGTAAYLGLPVTATDIANDVRWIHFKQPALSLGLKACWSNPICDSHGTILGTFALYFREERCPTDTEIEAVASCTSLCAIAMERHQRVLERERRGYVDALTQLPNRASLQAALASLSCVEAGAWAILVIDLDNLKTINDTFGHSTGDELIQTVASRVAAAVAPDRLYRMGGDEFVVVLQTAVTLGSIETAAHKILHALSAPGECGGHVVLPRATIGGAVLGRDEKNAETVRQNADFALYHAKETNIGGFKLYSPGMNSTIKVRNEAIRDVDAALREDRIDAYYQPIMRLDSREIIGLEALCRLRRPNGEIAPAADFHEATSDVSVASQLTGRMMTIVASDVRAWLDAGIPLQHVGINIASADFHSGTLFSRLATIFGRENVPLKHIILEVTESIYLGHRDPVVAKEIKVLRDRGLRIALDDFGTGFASLTHLLTVPVDIIKIDRSFIDRLAHGDPSLAIVGGVIEIARKLGIRLIAEGIEREEQAALLLELGCQLGQGYLFSKAMPRQITAELLSRFAQPIDQRRTTPEIPNTERGRSRNLSRF